MVNLQVSNSVDVNIIGLERVIYITSNCQLSEYILYLWYPYIN